VPVGVLLAIAALLLYSARSLLWQQTDVWVAPVVVRGAGASPGAAQNTDTVLVQAPGWVEADPYAISVPALTEGVVRDVLVLEGQRVEQGQVVATLIDEDAKLTVSRRRAQLEGVRAEAEAARAAVAVAEARADEVRDDVNRKRPVVTSGGVAVGEFAQLEVRLKTMEREVAAARSAIAVIEAKEREQAVACAEAELALDRTKVKSPVAGVVLARLVEPGTRISMENPSVMMGAVVRVYDPAKLQVRVDVPIAEAAKVGLGTEAQIVTEALPDRVFKGKVTRLVHEANIQRNTVQVKVAIENPSETLKPEMLTRVRFVGKSAVQGGVSATAASTGAGPQAVDTAYLIPTAALLHANGGTAHVFIVDNSAAAGATAAMRPVSFRPAMDGYVEATGPLHEGDRVIIEPLEQVRDGARVRVMGEKTGTEASHAAH
jgi:RND family efflux transporter MFP subunit